MEFREQVEMGPYTTFKIGGEARYFCTVTTGDELKEALAFAKERKLPFFIIGGGSNVLVSDKGFEGLVILMAQKGIVYEDKKGTVYVTAAAGEVWDDFVNETITCGLWGLENLSGIPGTVGASPVQNIGAYGVEVKDIIQSVMVLDTTTGQEKLYSNVDCQFAYRDSVFKKPESRNLVITSVTFKLSSVATPNLTYKDLKETFAGKTPSLGQIRDAVLSIRRGKFPDLDVIGTAGSFWKNPLVSPADFEKLKTTYPDVPSFPAFLHNKEMIKVPLAWILDHVCNLRGFSQIGNGKDGHGVAIGLFKNQPLVLVAEKGATQKDVDAFAHTIETLVKAKTGVVIEREVGSI